MQVTKGVITVVAGSEVEVFMLPDGSYLYSVKGVGLAINKTLAHTLTWLRANGCPVQTLQGVLTCDPLWAVTYWGAMADNGNPEAHNLMVALTAEAIAARVKPL